MNAIKRRAPIVVGSTTVAAGRRQSIEIPIARLVTGSMLSLPVVVVHGLQPGPIMWTAALHGDEIAGVEIIRRVLAHVEARDLSGTLLAVPTVNVFGLVNGDRYLPDRRDLNRAFPGPARGSLAARIAHIFMTEIVARSEYGLDFHTGSDHRTNWPQIRGDLDNDRVLECARAFAPSIMIHSRSRDGSLREAATSEGATVLLYEAGEALRFDPEAIACGTDGALRLMRYLGMLDVDPPPPRLPSLTARSTKWLRSPVSGILSTEVELGRRVAPRDEFGIVHNSFGKRLSTIRSPIDGWVIGHTQHPLVNRGDATFHIALR